MGDSVNKERIQLLHAALLSGEYSQTAGSLRDEEGFCCLGVATDVAIKAGLSCTWHDSAGGSDGVFLCEDATAKETASEHLLAAVQNWYGFEDKNPEVDIPCAECLTDNSDEDEPCAYCNGTRRGTEALSELNDDGWGFPGIAEAIEKTWL